jgi:hypothetical protein
MSLYVYQNKNNPFSMFWHNFTFDLKANQFGNWNKNIHNLHFAGSNIEQKKIF